MEATLLSNNNNNNNRRYTLPSTSFVDPAFVRFIEKANIALPEQQPLECYEEDEEENTTTTIPSSVASSPIISQRLSPPQPTASTSLDHLWSKQERYDNLELRLFALEESEKRFERRLQSLEKTNHNGHSQPIYVLQQQQPSDTDDMHNIHYMKLYHSLLEKYNALQVEFKDKEKQYQQRIQELMKQQQKEPEKPSYREEDGYLLFDTTNMNGEITHCKVKIPTPIDTKQQRRQQMIKTIYPPPTNNRPPQPYNMNISRHITPPVKKTLNPNAPEWKKKYNLTTVYLRQKNL